jgi:hypothetical protein
MPGKSHEVIDIPVETNRELLGPREADKSDPGAGKGGPQGTQRRYRAQHIAKLESAENCQCFDVRPRQ